MFDLKIRKLFLPSLKIAKIGIWLPVKTKIDSMQNF